MALKIAICCCNHLFAEALEILLEGERDIQIVGLFSGDGDLAQNMKRISAFNPDVIISDFTTFTGDVNNFIAFSNDLSRSDDLRILLIGDRATRFIADRQLKELIAKGIIGILPPSADSDLLKKAVKAIVEGEIWLDRPTIMKLLHFMKNEDYTP